MSVLSFFAAMACFIGLQWYTLATGGGQEFWLYTGLAFLAFGLGSGLLDVPGRGEK